MIITRIYQSTQALAGTSDCKKVIKVLFIDRLTALLLHAVHIFNKQALIVFPLKDFYSISNLLKM